MGGPTKRGPQVPEKLRECWTALQHILVCECIYLLGGAVYAIIEESEIYRSAVHFKFWYINIRKFMSAPGFLLNSRGPHWF